MAEQRKARLLHQGRELREGLTHGAAIREDSYTLERLEQGRARRQVLQHLPSACCFDILHHDGCIVGALVDGNVALRQLLLVAVPSPVSHVSHAVMLGVDELAQRGELLLGEHAQARRHEARVLCHSYEAEGLSYRTSWRVN